MGMVMAVQKNGTIAGDRAKARNSMKTTTSFPPAAQITILIAGLAVLGAGLVWFAGRAPTSPAANANVPAAGGGQTDGLTVRTETFTEETPTVDVKVSYPQVDGIVDISAGGGSAFGGEQAEMLNGELESTAIAWMDEFSREVADTASPDPLGTKSTVDISATVAFVSPEVMSVRYDANVYSAGAAHPNLFYKTLNWNVVHAAEIRADDLFVNEADWITRFSELAIADLERQFADAGDDFEAMSTDIRAGASAEADNFQAWTMDRDGITLHFEPYQVAAYAAGPQHVEIPWRALVSMLDVLGPAAYLTP
ncbi:DUF3298 domain-containing protein [Patescibacteria group bacterium]|nr:MAG: DUF3298 domain-containing protein [Patescibacteria group bacterium]